VIETNKAWCRDFSAPEGSTVLLKSQKWQQKKRSSWGFPEEKFAAKTCETCETSVEVKKIRNPSNSGHQKKGSEKDSEQKHEKTSPF